jgi:hypothetical protein
MNTQRQNAGGIVGGAILIGLGTLFLLGQLFNFQGWQYIWPLFVMGMGGIFFVGMLAGGKSMAGLAIPGSILTTIGLLLAVQNFTGNWASWSYAWTVIIMAVGIGILIMGAWSGDAQQRQAGLRVAGVGFVLFAIFGSFFELMIFGPSGSLWRQIVLPVVLILAGLYLVIRRTGLLPGRQGGSPNSAIVEGRPTPPAAAPRA